MAIIIRSKEQQTKDIKGKLNKCILSDRRHPNYSRTVRIAEKAFAFTTGDGLDKYMRIFVQRETDEMFKQRKDITQHIIKPIIQNLTFIINKIPRTSAMKLVYSDENRADKDKLDKVNDVYYAKKSLKNYLIVKNKLYDSIDPNTWLIHEFDSTDGVELAKIYPFIVPAEDAIDFEFENGVLEYLIIRQEVAFEYVEDGQEKYGKSHAFTIYTKDQNVKYVPYINKTLLGSIENGQEARHVIADDGQMKTVDVIKLKDHLYVIESPEAHMLGHVQARRIGYKEDSVTKGETFVPFWYDAEPFLMKLIKAVSEFDLTSCLHNFPQKFQYVPNCTNPQCHKGHLPDERTCPTCLGTSKMAHTSAQDTIELGLPDNKEELFDLQKLVNYVFPPVAGMIFMNQYVMQLIGQCKEAVYNSQVFSQKEIAQSTGNALDETATAKMIDYQSIYDTLYPYAVNFAGQWEFGIKTFAAIIKIDLTKLIIGAVVEKDFRLKSTVEIMAELKMARDSGTNSLIVRNIERELMYVMFNDRPTEIQHYDVQEHFNPFVGRTENEIIMLLASNFVPKRVKIFYGMSAYIFRKAAETEGFYDKRDEDQQKIIDTIIDEIEADLDVAPVLDLNPEV